MPVQSVPETPAALALSPALGLSSVLPVLLAGGRGSRLFELTEAEAKPALPLLVQGGQALRMIDFTMANLMRSGLQRAIVATEYCPKTLQRHLGHRWNAAFPGGLRLRDGADMTQGGYLGTGHAVAANSAEIDALAPDDLLILSGDHVYEMDYGPLIRAHRASDAAITVAVTHVPLAQAQAFGVVDAEATAGSASPIRAFAEKPIRPRASRDQPDQALVSMGVYVADWRWLREVLGKAMARAENGVDFGHDILPAAVATGLAQCWVFPAPRNRATAYWRDVGTLDALRETILDLTGFPPPCALPGPAAGAQTGAGVGRLSSLGSAVVDLLLPSVPRVPPTALLEESVLLPGARPGPGMRLKRVLVAPDTQLPAGLVIGEDPAEDARWFRRTEQGTVLVSAAMLARRAAERRRLVPVQLAPRTDPLKVMAMATGAILGGPAGRSGPPAVIMTRSAAEISAFRVWLKP